MTPSVKALWPLVFGGRPQLGVPGVTKTRHYIIMDDSSEIPVIDFSAYSLSLDKPDMGQFQRLVDEVHKALTSIGFFYIINTGFPQDKVDDMYRKSQQFFSLPVDMKLKYQRVPAKGGHGYVSFESERANPVSSHCDHKEAFDFNPTSAGKVWPTEDECPGFKTITNEFFDLCLIVHNRLLEVMGHGLRLDDPSHFLKYHSKAKTDSGMTVRSVRYPPCNEVPIKQQQVRCGDHIDGGTITLVFQGKPGLKVYRRDGSSINVPLVEGAILINTGRMMEEWTSGRYYAARHGIPVDGSSPLCNESCQLLALFGVPDNHAIIQSIS